MQIILKYKDAPELKIKVIDAYVKRIQLDAESSKRLLADKSWASSGSEFHNQCRAEKELIIKEALKQKQLLKSKKP